MVEVVGGGGGNIQRAEPFPCGGPWPPWDSHSSEPFLLVSDEPQERQLRDYLNPQVGGLEALSWSDLVTFSLCALNACRVYSQAGPQGT